MSYIDISQADIYLWISIMEGSLCRSKFYVGHPMSDKSRSFNSNQKNAFERSRKEINAAIDKICEFSGTILCCLRFLLIHEFQRVSADNFFFCLFRNKGHFLGLEGAIY